MEGTDRGLASKRKRVDELPQQPARHSLWEQDSLEALNEVLFGCLDDEVEALQQRRAVYDEERRLCDEEAVCETKRAGRGGKAGVWGTTAGYTVRTQQWHGMD